MADEFSACGKTEPNDRAQHRLVARERADRCFTCCSGVARGGRTGGADTCLGCDAVVAYYSCAPGYCVLCAHDPCWVTVAIA